MKIHPLTQRGMFAAVILLTSTAHLCPASDHADPMSMNVLKVQETPEANITDLHAFVVDKDGKLITGGNPTATGDQLIVSLCVRRALRPEQIEELQLKGFKFRVHIDLSPPVHLFEEGKTRDGADYGQLLAALNSDIESKTVVLEQARVGAGGEGRANTTAQTDAERSLTAALERRGRLIAAQEADRSMQALYGGVITKPEAIAETVVLEFELGLEEDGEQSQATIRNHSVQGITGATNIVTREKRTRGNLQIRENEFQPGAINIEAGVFDDPFIFPRFFRRNVVGIVTSIPLASLQQSTGRGPIVLWATTHTDDGRQVDHVGRSLRTQLPRFGYLNTKHPASHVDAITRIHDRPSVVEDILATVVSPLFAHRHYDSVPDVIVYDLRRPARFPNGRALPDDVGGILSAAGETLLVELSYAESKQFPRATTNDKEFRDSFPYLAPRWTKREVAAHLAAGTTMGSFAVPRAPDTAAIAAPNFKNSSWRTFWALEVAGIALLTLLLLITLRSKALRVLLILIAILAVYLLHFVYAPNLAGPSAEAMAQPARKMSRLLLGFGLIVALALSWLFALGLRLGGRRYRAEPFPRGDQELTAGEDVPPSHGFAEIYDAVFGEPYYGKTWFGPERTPLPIYKQTLTSIAGDLFHPGREFAMLRAARRTLKSRADLRWGSDGKGFRRLLHPVGICLAGEWKIDHAPPGTAYSGYFAPGSVGRVIARYSLGGNDPRNGHNRSLGLVGKVFPSRDTAGHDTPRANFITQEDLGGALTRSITEVELTNSPPVTLLKRGPGLFAFLVVIAALLRADRQPAERQLYEIAELEKPDDAPTSCPRFMRLKVVEESPADLPLEADFREEILRFIYDPGDPNPKRSLTFNIEVSDEGKRTIFQRLKGQNWTQIGQIDFTEAAASYNGDFVIHFRHPPWRTDRNDPRTVARARLRP